MPFLRIGTRGSKLALFQARLVRDLLCQAHDIVAADIEIITIKTTGDRVTDRPLAEIGGKGLFTKEIEEALFEDKIDIAVHSMKDMAAFLPDGLGIAAVLKREDPRDAFLSNQDNAIDELPLGAKIGCSSVRRTAQLLSKRPDLKIHPFRGNLDTRISKLKSGEVDGTFLATAGLNRLGLENEITQKLEIFEMLPAPAQGIIGIETRNNAEKIYDLLKSINHHQTQIQMEAERGFLQGVDGSCRTPVAAHAIIQDQSIKLMAEALTLDGTQVFKVEQAGDAADARKLGFEAAKKIKIESAGVLTL